MPPGLDIRSVSEMLKLLSSMGQLVPVAGQAIAGALEIASKICDIAQDVKSNKQTVEQLAVAAGLSLVEITSIIQRADEAKQHEYEDQVSELYRVLQEIEETTSSLAQQNRLVRVLNRSKIKAALVDLDDKLSKVSARFGVYQALRSTISLDALHARCESIQEAQKEMEAAAAQRHVEITTAVTETIAAVENTHITAQKSADSALLEKLNPVATGWNADVVDASVSCCLENTRVQLLRDISDWALSGGKDTSPTIFWLSGLAGTGKSTIARTACQLLAPRSTCISFFFSRQSAERRDPSRVACTLAYQIALSDSSMRAKICKVVEDNPDVATRSITEQIQLLISEPLQACPALPHPLMIVLDALDECDKRDQQEGGTLLPLLVAAIQHPGILHSVRLLVTSRGETSIRTMFDKLKQHAPHELVQLHEIQHSIVREDITHYLEYRLHAIRERVPGMLPIGWPEPGDITALVDRAGGLFVYAATLVRFIDSQLDSPAWQLRSILDGTVDDSDAAYGVVDKLYLQILDKAVGSQARPDHPYCKRFREIVGSLILAREPMPVECLACLIGIEVEKVTLLFRQLTAVLIVPISGPVMVFHPSFPDFVTDSTRCQDVRFLIDSSTHHTKLAQQCLFFMNKHLKRDICNIQYPYLMNCDVPDLSVRIQENIPAELMYACKHWANHLFLASHNKATLASELLVFCQTKLLYWVEVLSLTGALHSAYSMLSLAQGYLIKQSTTSFLSESAGLLSDLNHLLRDIFPAIQDAALHVYSSALPLMPQGPLLDLTHHEPTSAVQLLTEREKGWREGLLHILKGSITECCKLMAFLSDSVSIILLGYMDRGPLYRKFLVEIWNTETGELTFKTSETCYLSVGYATVAISPDKRCFALNTGVEVSIWSTNGQCLLKLDGLEQTCDIGTLVFSSDGKHIAASCGNKIQSWNAYTGDLEATVILPTKEYITEFFLPEDNNSIVCYTVSLSIYIWSLSSHELIAQINQLGLGFLSIRMGCIAAIVYEPPVDGDDCSLIYKEWSMHGTLKKVTVLEQSQVIDYTSPFNGRVCMYVCSRHNEMLLSSDHQGNLCLWNVISGVFLGKLEQPGDGHLWRTAEFSNDGCIVIGCSKHQLFCIWDTYTRKPKALFNGHPDSYVKIAISLDSTQFVSHSHNGTIYVWDIPTLQQEGLLPMGSTAISTISISDDATLIVSLSKDNQIMLWDGITGQLKRCIDRISGFQFIGITISDNCSYIIGAALADQAWQVNKLGHVLTCIWDCTTGQYMPGFIAHNDYPQALGLSNDGVLAMASHDGMYMWSIHQPTPLPSFTSSDGNSGLALSSDGLHVAVPATRFGRWTLPVLEVPSGQTIASLALPPYPNPKPVNRSHLFVRVKYIGDSLHIVLIDDSVATWSTFDRANNYLPSAHQLPYVLFYDPSSRWICCRDAKRLYCLCWIPHRLCVDAWDSSWHGNIVVLGGPNGLPTIIDCTPAITKFVLS